MVSDKNGADKVKEFMGSGKKSGSDQDSVKEAMTVVYKAISTEVIELNSKNEYIYLKGEKAGKALFAVGNKADKEKALAVFLSKSKKDLEELTAACE